MKSLVVYKKFVMVIKIVISEIVRSLFKYQPSKNTLFVKLPALCYLSIVTSIIGIT